MACNRFSYSIHIQRLKYFGKRLVKSIVKGVQFIAHLAKLRSVRCVPRRACDRYIVILTDLCNANKKILDKISCHKHF